jgi:hypothetical protein
VKLLLPLLIFTLPLFARVEIILESEKRSVKRFPIYFLPERDVKTEKEELESSTPLPIRFQVGARYIFPATFVLTDSMFDNSTRDIEFFSTGTFSPYFQIKLDDLEIFRKKGLFFGNMFELNYLSMSEQTPFYPQSGEYPYQTSYDIGTELSITSLFWRGDLFYKNGFFSVGGYVGTGFGSVSGDAKFVRYAQSNVTDINGTSSENLHITDSGEILEYGGEHIASGGISNIIKIGFGINIDFEPIHIGFGYDRSSISESNQYWILGGYYIEIGYQF